MRQFFISSTGADLNWLIFIGLLLLICSFTGIFVIWFTLFRGKKKGRRKRRHRHHRNNPSLAEIGGLPPRREDKKTDPPPP